MRRGKVHEVGGSVRKSPRSEFMVYVMVKCEKEDEEEQSLTCDLIFHIYVCMYISLCTYTFIKQI